MATPTSASPPPPTPTSDSASSENAIDLLGHALLNPAEPVGQRDDGDDPPLCATAVR
ncbi:hypothetical protein [Streptomyces sp. SID8374]|uniref:hypothetical protein n=1 Tax=Streptomyces sp. SID8374 TaxID=2690354 RepID=UPI001929330C|nr:hypothetical protein [Streptomyces sp. SID8374]